jgi:hypothetical protein
VWFLFHLAGPGVTGISGVLIWGCMPVFPAAYRNMSKNYKELLISVTMLLIFFYKKSS